MKKQITLLAVLAAMAGVPLLLGAGGGPDIVKAETAPAGVSTDAKAANPSEPTVEPAKETTAARNATRPKLSFGVDEVVRMYQGGVETDVILNYVENSNVPYHLGAEEVLQLHDVGLPSPVITALIRHGAKVQQQAATAYAQSQLKATEEAKAASANANTYSTSAYAVATPPVVPSAYPTYVDAGYPAYSYPSYYSYPGYYYSSPFYFRFGYPGFRGYYSHRGFAGHPSFGIGARFGHSPRGGIGVRF